MKFELRPIVASSLTAVSLLAVIGCGGGTDIPAVYPVTGVILRDGVPLADVNVDFLPDNGRPSSGSTDKDGKFVLEYLKGTRGALKGSHKIRVEERFQGADPNAPPMAVPPPEPKTYNLPQPVQVNATTNKFVIDVTAGTATSSS